MNKIRIGILGYGNLGKGVETGLKHAKDMKLVGVFSRRDAKSLGTKSPVFHVDKLQEMQEEIDVLILCGSSDKDIPKQGPDYVRFYNTVDSFDNHAKIPEYFEKMNKVATDANKVSIISTGWDPGLFSMNRMLAEAILPKGKTYTFWGKGLSQGHSAAVRQWEGVQDAVQYTIPSEKMISDIRSNKEVDYTSETAHVRDVYVVLKEGTETEEIKEAIATMPDYFSNYDTTVNIISQEELDENHRGMPHGGHVMRVGETSENTAALYEFSLQLESNPEFTAAVNIAFARAAYRLGEKGNKGAFTVLDVPPAYLSPITGEELRRTIL